MTEQEMVEFESIDEDENLPSSYRDIVAYIKRNPNWECEAINAVPENWFSWGRNYSSDVILKWYDKYRNGCNGIQVFFTGRNENPKTKAICRIDFSVVFSAGNRRSVGHVTFDRA